LLFEDFAAVIQILPRASVPSARAVDQKAHGAITPLVTPTAEHWSARVAPELVQVHDRGGGCQNLELTFGIVGR